MKNDTIGIDISKATLDAHRLSDTAKILGCSLKTIRRRIEAGELVTIRDGRLVAEALDRLSRDQERIAGIFKRLSFAGVKIITLSEGEIGHLHIGLKGTMNALFLKDLVDKTRRGLRGRVEAGNSGGGKSYGHDVFKRFDADGEAIRGDRTINQREAANITRIFADYSVGKSPKAIAAQLNTKGIPGPTGKTWVNLQSTGTANVAPESSIMNSM